MSSRLLGNNRTQFALCRYKERKRVLIFLGTPNNQMKIQMILKLSTENFALSVDCFSTQGSAAEP